MSFQNQFVVASCKNQLIPQQLTNNVFFGPLNTLSQLDFLQTHNIKFFVAVGIPTSRVAQYCKSMSAEHCLVVNFDSEFSPQTMLSQSDLDLTSQYCQTQSMSLELLRSRVAAQTATYYNSDRGLTPQPELDQTLYHSANNYNCNVITAEGISKFETFNDLLTLFKLSNSGNVLVFSSSGNDQELVALLISHILQNNTETSLMEAFQYIRSLRPSIASIQPDSIFWCQGLTEFADRIRLQTTFSQNNDNSMNLSVSSNPGSIAAKRRTLVSSDDEDDYSDSTNITVGSFQPDRSASGTPKARKIGTRLPDMY
ncbi:LANO_0C01530g1_1 [Lachancea nothofagi CBS 11611]|uniref:LANO_0C01530g1_1 n=1 Tax=Lachancea nothofagi CBS 11611 TaxID=1266666 RepID=A0A1G4J4F4_9SACH|nr:LANO_0C01530g1_1 [Lachancea nothofagi CBS 11611]